MILFAKRNLKLYFKDFPGVAFSLIGVFVIILLYVIFLADSLMSDMSMLAHPEATVDIWVLAGILQVATLTTATGALHVMVDDSLNQKLKDFYVLPTSNRNITRGYFLNAYLVSLIMSITTFIFSLIYLYAARSYSFEFVTICKTLALLLLCAFSSSAMAYFIMSFIKSGTAFTAASTIIGTFIGFITGVYFPIGSVAAPVQKGMMLFPLSHGSSLLRKVLLEDIIAKNFINAPEEVKYEFQKTLGIVFVWSDTEISSAVSFAFLVISGIVFLFFGNLVASRQSE